MLEKLFMEKLFMFMETEWRFEHNNTQTMMGVGQLRWQCYRRHQQNP